MKKKVISLFICLAVCLLFSVGAMAVDDVQAEQRNKLPVGAGSACAHTVNCDNRSVCLKCDRTDLTEEEISEVIHPYAFCYDLTKCGVCGDEIEEGSVETVHSLDVNVKYIPDEYVHWTTCFCGEVMDEEPFEHFAVCTQEDTSVCFRCGAQVEGIEVDHIHRQEYQDEVYHWVGCLDCGEEVVPKIKHYTYCFDPDGPCVGCGRPNDQCIIDDENRGIHDAFTAPDQLIEVDDEYVHYCYCRMCETEVTYHRGIVCEDFGDMDTHKVACAVCGHTFNDMEHGEPVIWGADKATCTKKGYTGDEICKDCGHIFHEGTEIEVLGHEFEDGICIRCGARESSCEHIVNCDDRTVCIVCGMTELIEEEISEVQHLYTFCYNPTTCAYCHEPIEAGSVLETMHLLDVISEAKFYPVGDMHRVTCNCGEVSGEELLPHQIICTQEDKSVCDLCGGDAGDNPYVVHFGDEIPMHDENCHWVICGNCGENVSGNSKHYTSCTNPDATECAFCGVSTDECVIEEAYRGLHDNPYLLDERLIEEDGEYIHYCYCYACDTQVAYHHGIICNDYGDDVDHGVVCAECGHRFNDMKHGKTVIRGTKKATCTKNGYTGDKVCEDCGHVFKKGSLTKALGHEYQNGKCIRCGAKDENTQVIPLGTSGLIMIADVSYISEETTGEGQVAAYRSSVYPVSFDIYQAVKSEGETLRDIAAKEAVEFGAECTETAFNGIPAVCYEATAEGESAGQTFRAIFVENGNAVVKIVFWMNGKDAGSLVDAIVNTIAAQK